MAFHLELFSYILFSMRTCIDIGGTKVLAARLDDSGNIVSSEKRPTPKRYQDLIGLLTELINGYDNENTTIVIGTPGKIDRASGIVVSFGGNIDWENKALGKDLSVATGRNVCVENDANLAGLGEHWALKDTPAQSLYVTISTGIGTGVITNGQIDPHHADSEGGEILIEYNGELDTWEHIASGKAIVARYGSRASDIKSESDWQDICHWLAIGFVNLLAVLEPDVIVIGGGVGSHFDKFGPQLKEEIDKIKPPLINVPPIVKASKPEEAVILGCYRLSLSLDQDD